MKTALIIALTTALVFLIFQNQNSRERVVKYTKGENLYFILLICLLIIPALFDYRFYEKIQELKRKLNN